MAGRGVAQAGRRPRSGSSCDFCGADARGRSSSRPVRVASVPCPPHRGAAPRCRRVIRLAREDDWPSILEVHRAAFGPEDVPRIASELHARADLYVPELSFVAEDGGAVVGHVMNTWNRIEETGKRVLQLSPLGVLPSHQRAGSRLRAGSCVARRRAGGGRAAPARRGRSRVLRSVRLRPRRRARPATAAGSSVRLGFSGGGAGSRSGVAAGLRRLLGAVQALSKRERDPQGGAITAICSHGMRHFDPLTAVPPAQIRAKTSRVH